MRMQETTSKVVDKLKINTFKKEKNSDTWNFDPEKGISEDLSANWKVAF